jgi:SAM-dependent methyltransferase
MSGHPPQSPFRHPHAVLNLQSRQWKAIKIERLLDLDRRPGPLRMLEVGTGSGGIAHYFGTHESGRFTVDAVDVVDNRQIVDGYRYTDVTDTRLPFNDASFDIVLSNHVIEHVGDEGQQRAHLAELRRVMRDDGVGYLAVPNRWMLVEPHYKLIFLSWLPERFRTPYLRWSRKGDVYDCRPLTSGKAARLLHAAGFICEQQCARALLLTFELERPKAMLYRLLLRRIPSVVYQLLAPIFPTLIYKMCADPDHDSGGPASGGESPVRVDSAG